ncbi:hypothetical protein E8E14_009670 [Neopestalotiopsis sp. 37M]|nr:hypothetical protein E8E14_009670 [Neopestalotiopsis sp. 37M]
MTGQSQFARYASKFSYNTSSPALCPDEQRIISREDLGFYHGLIVGAVLNFGNREVPLSPEIYFHPLSHCIRQHTQLSVVVRDAHTNKAFFEYVPTVNLKEHVSIHEPVSADRDESAAIQEVLRLNLDVPFPSGTPPWKIIVLPLQSSRCFMAYVYSHAIGDGVSGAAFQRTFLNAWPESLEEQHTAPAIIARPTTPLPAPFDTSERLSISWLFLLIPQITVLLPAFVRDWLGLQVGISPIDDGTWTGAPAAFDHQTSSSKVVLRVIPAPIIESVLRASTSHDATLSGTLQQVVARALIQAIPNPDINNLVSQQAINMRGSIGVPDEQMGNFFSGYYIAHLRKHCSSGPLSTVEWESAAETSKNLEEAAARLEDQPIGLLRYLSSIRNWLLGKIGKRRDNSFEVSNAGMIELDAQGQHAVTAGKHIRVETMVFAQPGHVSSAPLAFNFISLKGGPLAFTVTWPEGALNMPVNEEQFVEGVCSSIMASLENLSK